MDVCTEACSIMEFKQVANNKSDQKPYFMKNVSQSANQLQNICSYTTYTSTHTCTYTHNTTQRTHTHTHTHARTHVRTHTFILDFDHSQRLQHIQTTDVIPLECVLVYLIKYKQSHGGSRLLYALQYPTVKFQ